MVEKGERRVVYGEERNWEGFGYGGFVGYGGRERRRKKKNGDEGEGLGVWVKVKRLFW